MDANALFDTITYYDDIVSLGKHCQVRWYLRSHGFKPGDFVFGNLLSDNLSTVIHLMETRFSNFFNFNDAEQIRARRVSGIERVEHRYHVIDHGTNLQSGHDFGEALSKETHALFMEKKRREIKHLFDALENSHDVLFVRVNNKEETLENTVHLYDTLKSIRKNKNFQLYVFQEAEFVRKNWGIPGLSMFYDGQWKYRTRWEGNLDLWDQIFRNIKVRSHRSPIHWSPRLPLL